MASTQPKGTNIAGFLGEHLALLKKDLSFSGYERDVVALNLRGKGFLDISGVSGADSPSDGRGAVYLDYDDDGDLDIFLRAMHGRAHFLYRNEVGQERGFVRIALEGTRSGRDAFGTVVRMKTSAGLVTRIKSGGSGFLSEHDPRLLFGLGADDACESLEVIWPSGARQDLPGVPKGSFLHLREPAE